MFYFVRFSFFLLCYLIIAVVYVGFLYEWIELTEYRSLSILWRYEAVYILCVLIFNSHLTLALSVADLHDGLVFDFFLTIEGKTSSNVKVMLQY